jgi:hypothetical protein
MEGGGLVALGPWHAGSGGGHGSSKDKGDEQQREERMREDGACDQERIRFLSRA